MTLRMLFDKQGSFKVSCKDSQTAEGQNMPKEQRRHDSEKPSAKRVFGRVHFVSSSSVKSAAIHCHVFERPLL